MPFERPKSSGIFARISSMVCTASQTVSAPKKNAQSGAAAAFHGSDVLVNASNVVELAEHDDVIGIVPLEVPLQVAQTPETEVVFEHLVWPHHLVLLLRQHETSSRLDRTVTLHAVE